MLTVLFGVAVLAGFVDTLAGGGGLITLPALMVTGMPPVCALATNKLQGSFGALMATGMMLHKRLLKFADVRSLFGFALLGGILGAACAQFIDARALDFVTPVILASIALYFVLAPKTDAIERKPRLVKKWYQRLVLPVIGFYDGMFGPGAGSFYCVSGVALRGQSLVKATANAKALNLASNLAALTIYIVGGKVMWKFGAVMMLGQVIGTFFGSLLLSQNRPALVRPMIVSACFVMLGRLLWQRGLFVF